MLFDEWRKFKGWIVLEFFLAKDERIHLKGLSRRLKISPQTAQIYLGAYEQDQILEKEKLGNMTLYKLATNFKTMELKRLYFLLMIEKYINSFIRDNSEITSLVLYGSHADGSYDKSSDIDVLIVSQEKKLELRSLRLLEEKIGKEVKTETFSIGEIRAMAGKQSNFYLSLLRNNILLYGAKL
ncbi:MAG TPA: nucleotidyltransferase domain-containing protein [Candidatus Saccharimonadales bacterium]|nr:nucleotidyltransferase domain-containing protein [Candidatus Saccharimonadales bacterium]